MGAALEQRSGDLWQPLGFFSQLFSPAQQKYSTYDRELTAIYEAIRHFLYYLEGVEFKIYMDHKPLVYALQQNSDKMPAIRARRLSYIAQFNTKICYLPGEENDVADALSSVNTFTSPTHFDWSDPQLLTDPEVRKVLANINAFRLPTFFDPTQLSQEQANDEQIKEIAGAPSQASQAHLGSGSHTVLLRLLRRLYTAICAGEITQNSLRQLSLTVTPWSESHDPSHSPAVRLAQHEPWHFLLVQVVCGLLTIKSCKAQQILAQAFRRSRRKIRSRTLRPCGTFCLQSRLYSCPHHHRSLHEMARDHSNRRYHSCHSSWCIL